MADGESATAVLAVTIVASLLATSAFLLRFLVRYTQNDFWAPDDYAFCATFLLIWSCAGCNFVTLATRQGFVEAQGQPPTSDLNGLLVAIQICWIFAATSAKAAVVLFYRRLFIRAWVQKSAYVLLGLLGAILLTGIVFFGVNQGYALSGNAGVGVVNSVLGVAILLLPPAVIFTLNMSIRRKLVRIVWFSLGWLALACSITRLASFGVQDMSLYQQKRLPLILCLSILEPTLWITAGSGPTIRQLWRRRQRHSQDSRHFARASRAQVSGDNFTSASEDVNLTALPPLPRVVVRQPRGITRQRSPDTIHDGRRQDNILQGGTVRPTTPITRQSSVRTDRGMYTHWRQDDDA